MLILGSGAVGLLCAAVSRFSGAKSIIMADILEDRVNFALQNGFADGALVVPRAAPRTTEEKLAFAKDLSEKLKALQADGEADGEFTITYECTGVESCLQTAIYVNPPLLEIER